jgi:hypothetical protein
VFAQVTGPGGRPEAVLRVLTERPCPCFARAGARFLHDSSDAPAGRRRTRTAIISGVTNRAATALRLTAVATASLAVSGCAVFSTVQTDEPYIPADGVPLNIPGLSLRNLAIVTGEADGPGVLIGQVVNESASAVDVQFGIQGGPEATGSTTVPAYSGDTLSGEVEQIEIPDVPAEPGGMVTLTVTTSEAGQNVVLIPVLLDNRYYTDLFGGTL